MGAWGPFIVLAGLLSGVAPVALAQTSVDITASRCGAEPLPAGRVTRVVDGRSFVLQDGREVRLASLEVPPATSPTGQAAEAALTAMLAGEAVSLRAATAAPDRYGRTLAYVAAHQGQSRVVAHASVAPTSVAQISVTQAMLAQGHARVGADVSDGACAAELLAQERGARISKKGLWGDPQYAILWAGNLAGLVAGRGRFAVVEGKVLSVRESGGTIYVNFGRRWSQALTVTISKRQERMFSGAGREPRGLENRYVRVRGWIEIRNGPRIEASHLEQIELGAAN
jgi:endonuclease YncB( thermonuclease family)